MKKIVILLALLASTTCFGEVLYCGGDFISRTAISNECSSDIIIKYSEDKRYVGALYNSGYEFSLYDLVKKEVVFALAPLKQMKSFWFEKNETCVIKYGKAAHGKVGYSMKTGKLLWKNSLFGVLPRGINRDRYYIH